MILILGIFKKVYLQFLVHIKKCTCQYWYLQKSVHTKKVLTEKVYIKIVYLLKKCTLEIVYVPKWKLLNIHQSQGLHANILLGQFLKTLATFHVHKLTSKGQVRGVLVLLFTNSFFFHDLWSKYDQNTTYIDLLQTFLAIFRYFVEFSSIFNYIFQTRPDRFSTRFLSHWYKFAEPSKTVIVWPYQHQSFALL